VVRIPPNPSHTSPGYNECFVLRRRISQQRRVIAVHSFSSCGHIEDFRTWFNCPPRCKHLTKDATFIWKNFYLVPAHASRLYLLIRLTPIKYDYFVCSEEAKVLESSAPVGLGSCLLGCLYPPSLDFGCHEENVTTRSAQCCGDKHAEHSFEPDSDPTKLAFLENRTLLLSLSIARQTVTSLNGVLSEFDDVIA
jgi:hypothetical protein